jgi:hypothetical protein
MINTSKSLIVQYSAALSLAFVSSPFTSFTVRSSENLVFPHGRCQFLSDICPLLRVITITPQPCLNEAALFLQLEEYSSSLSQKRINCDVV